MNTAFTAYSIRKVEAINRGFMNEELKIFWDLSAAL